MSTMKSSSNPFLSPPISTNPTGASGFSASMEGPSSSSGQPPVQRTPEPEPRSRSDSLGIEEDMPPAYTPSADIHQGESTVDVGPRRPFQPPPQHPQQNPNQHIALQGTGWSQPQQSFQQPPPTISYAPPPTASRFSGHASYHQRNISLGSRRQGGLLSRALTEIVRDVVDVISGVPENRPYQQQQGYVPANAYATPYPPSTAHRSSSSRDLSTRRPQPASNVPDDGTPTTTPVPGHPLLRDGMLLVYTHGYICVKCRNTGYKNYDPSHPCRKCWDKFGKSYTGALTYTPWSNNPSSTSTSRNSFQRPLPSFTPPHMSTSSSRSVSSAYPPPQNDHHQQSYNQQQQQYYAYNPVAGLHPPPGAITVKPGDPRLGGCICWRCGGLGSLSVLIIDVRPCPVCAGTGRVPQ
ncbi:hypothetical protein SERLA73DRAFT_185206 [Serpula lacrymans var. lacrymans S7.3]|uniref:Uncharacterized protein n=2 Tax=Serpula lacrymans var. lacrymans TaxID=341189 RepID=F8Q496_SERL3|nr:uncharacterized protein SERLADRAFT_473522 [Serpula lacrymans var. lacrymans S7.9]EGN96951.1 hypothetical protein SERLA73DRAFT_185206 [Serpula lacrymans var. lacrymans S7.3]EGO22546.1 hypothetical protein SERLADRAFT_473522 [Serpula lacrymans var. lacrymans S7.9]